MTQEYKKKVALFVCHDVTGMLIVNQIVPLFLNMGIEPVLFNTGLNRNRVFKVPTPAIVAYFNALLINDVLIPIIQNANDNDAVNTSYQGLAKRFDLKYHDIENVNENGFISSVERDDLYIGAIAIRFLQVFEKPIIDMFHKKGFMWNLHSGLLPKYKGLLTPYRAIQNKEKSYGMTLHDLTVGIDEGRILAKAELPLDTKRPVFDLYLDLVPHGAKIITDTLQKYLNDNLGEGEEQEKALQKSYYTNPTRQEFMEFMIRGIVFAQPFDAVERLVGFFAKKNTFLESVLLNNLLSALETTSMQAEKVAKERRARSR